MTINVNKDKPVDKIQRSNMNNFLKLKVLVTELINIY